MGFVWFVLTSVCLLVWTWRSGIRWLFVVMVLVVLTLLVVGVVTAPGMH
jgi:hypothetical protein